MITASYMAVVDTYLSYLKVMKPLALNYDIRYITRTKYVLGIMTLSIEQQFGCIS